QAEGGIRDFHVTGVQTCALPIYREVRRIEPVHRREPLEDVVGDAVNDLLVAPVHDRVQAAERAEPRRGARAAQEAVALDQDRRRAEERRVGKEGGWRMTRAG